MGSQDANGGKYGWQAGYTCLLNGLKNPKLFGLRLKYDPEKFICLSLF